MANPIQEVRDDAWEAFRQVGGAVAHPPDDAGASRPVRARWTVAGASPKTRASSAVSMNGI